MSCQSCSTLVIGCLFNVFVRFVLDDRLPLDEIHAVAHAFRNFSIVEGRETQSQGNQVFRYVLFVAVLLCFNYMHEQERARAHRAVQAIRYAIAGLLLLVFLSDFGDDVCRQPFTLDATRCDSRTTPLHENTTLIHTHTPLVSVDRNATHFSDGALALRENYVPTLKPFFCRVLNKGGKIRGLE